MKRWVCCGAAALAAGLATSRTEIVMAAPAAKTACTAPSDTNLNEADRGNQSLVIVSGRVEGAEKQVVALRRALADKGLTHLKIDLVLVDESVPERILGQLDAKRLDKSLAVVTVSGHIARTLSSLKLASPTVFVTIADPLSWGIVDSLGPRKNNVTGATYVVDLEWKPLELLRLAFPGVRRIGLLADSYFFEREIVKEMIAQAPSRTGHTVLPFVAESREELERVFTTVAAQTVDAWVVPETPVVFRQDMRVVELVSQRRIPNIFAHPSMLKKGAIMTFGVEFADMWAELAQMIGLICSGVDANQIPVVRPHRVFFGVSPTNARRMGLEPDPKIYRISTFTH